MSRTREWVRTQKASITSQINGLNQKIDEHQATIQELKDQKSALQTELAELTSDQTALGDV